MDEAVKAAQAELKLAAEEAEAEGVDTDSCWSELVAAACFMIEDDDVARELCRRELGYVPHDLRSRLGDADWLDS